MLSRKKKKPESTSSQIECPDSLFSYKNNNTYDIVKNLKYKSDDTLSLSTRFNTFFDVSSVRKTHFGMPLSTRQTHISPEDVDEPSELGNEFLSNLEYPRDFVFGPCNILDSEIRPKNSRNILYKDKTFLSTRDMLARSAQDFHLDVRNGQR